MGERPYSFFSLTVNKYNKTRLLACFTFHDNKTPKDLKFIIVK